MRYVRIMLVQILHVLIVPLWNWNYVNYSDLERVISSSNRTFMELKFSGPSSFTEGASVLIVPLWNWNQINQALAGDAMRSNRTFMELKFGEYGSNSLRPHVLIVPLWNWNMIRPGSRTVNLARSNRTFMELKWGAVFFMGGSRRF